MAELVGYYDDKKEEFVFTRTGLKMAASNALGKWRIVAELEGLVREEDEFLLSDDVTRHLVVELSKQLEQSEITDGPSADESDEVCRRVTRVTRLDENKISLRDALAELHTAKEDIFVGFVVFYEVELKLYRTDFTKKFGAGKKKRNK